MFRHLLGDQGPTFSALNLTIVNRKHVFYIVTVIFQVCRHSGAGNRNLCGRQPFRGGKIGLFAKNPVPRGLKSYCRRLFIQQDFFCNEFSVISGSAKISPHEYLNYHRRNYQTTTSSENTRVTESLYSHKILPSHARVVICGGGIIGTSVAYHLTSLGWTDVVLLEQGSLTCGTTWHAGALLWSLKNRAIETKISAYSINLYKELSRQGHEMGIKECGSLHLARTPNRMTNLRKVHARAKDLGVEAYMIQPREIASLCSLINTNDLQGGMWVPGDISGSAGDICLTLAKLAKEKGAKMMEGCKVKCIKVGSDTKVTEVITNKGKIKCDFFVNAAGQWSRRVGLLSDPMVAIPVHPCEETYIVTKPLEGISQSKMPLVLDHDGHLNLSEWSGGLLIGGASPSGKSAYQTDYPADLEYNLLPDDWDHFQPVLSQALHRLPILEKASFRQMFNGAEGTTPDGKWILGECPEIKNYFVCAGMCGSGITAAGGIGKLLAEWIVHGEPVMDLWSLDMRRFLDIHNNTAYLKERAQESYAMRNTVSYPRQENQSARKLRTSPLYTVLAKSGAWFGEKNGFERAMFFRDSDDELYQDSSHDSSTLTFHKPGWFDTVEVEYWACRESVALVDMSAFTKFEIRSAGLEVVDFLQRMCANDIDLPIGTVVHTGMLNEHGCYENDCSITRMADNCFFIVSPTSQQTRSFTWLSRHLPKDRSVLLRDVHSMYTALNVVGPRAQDLLSEVTDSSLKTADFNMMTCREIDIGNASGIRAMRYTHTGEDGFMLYIPSEFALHVYDTLARKGENYGLRNVGYNAIRSLRIEKFFSYWGVDITPLLNPYEVGREFRVCFSKDFIGKEALLKVKEEGYRHRLVHLTLEDHHEESDPWSWGGDPVYRNGVFAGTVTSSVYGYTLNRMVCLAVVADIDPKTGEKNIINHEWVLKNCQYEVDIAGKRYQAKQSIYPPMLKSAGSHKYIPKTIDSLI